MPLQSEEPAEPDPMILLVGRDRRGRWTVQENHGLLGGAFISRDAALHFARAERLALPGCIIAMADNPMDEIVVH